MTQTAAENKHIGIDGILQVLCVSFLLIILIQKLLTAVTVYKCKIPIENGITCAALMITVKTLPF